MVKKWTEEENLTMIGAIVCRYPVQDIADMLGRVNPTAIYNRLHNIGLTIETIRGGIQHPINVMQWNNTGDE